MKPFATFLHSSYVSEYVLVFQSSTGLEAGAVAPFSRVVGTLSTRRNGLLPEFAIACSSIFGIVFAGLIASEPAPFLEKRIGLHDDLSLVQK
jgi:hypothetical protein